MPQIVKLLKVITPLTCLVVCLLQWMIGTATVSRDQGVHTLIKNQKLKSCEFLRGLFCTL